MQNRLEDKITTFAILKKRQPEVAVILAVGLLSWLGPMGASLIRNSILLRGSWLIMLAIAALLLILRAGFLRTAYLYGDKRQRIVTLLQTGRPFFWQLFIFACLYGIIRLAPTLILVRFISPSKSWVVGLFNIALAVVLIKPLLLVPAMIIVHKMRAFEGLKCFMKYHIFEAKELLILFAAQQVFRLLHLFVRPLLSKPRIVYYFTSATTNIIMTLLGLAIALSAVLFVGSKTAPATEPTEGPENNLTAD